MATLVKPLPMDEEVETDLLSDSVPTPFPVAALATSRPQHKTAAPSIWNANAERHTPLVEVSPPTLPPGLEQNATLTEPPLTRDDVDQPVRTLSEKRDWLMMVHYRIYDHLSPWCNNLVSCPSTPSSPTSSILHQRFGILFFLLEDIRCLPH